MVLNKKGNNLMTRTAKHNTFDTKNCAVLSQRRDRNIAHETGNGDRASVALLKYCAIFLLLWNVAYIIATKPFTTYATQQIYTNKEFI